MWADCIDWDTVRSIIDTFLGDSLCFGLLLNLGDKSGSPVGELNQLLSTWLLSSEVTEIFSEVRARQQMKSASLYGVSILCGHSSA